MITYAMLKSGQSMTGVTNLVICVKQAFGGLKPGSERVNLVTGIIIIFVMCVVQAFGEKKIGSQVSMPVMI